MKTTIRSPILAAVVLGLACTVQALPITPTTGVLDTSRWEGNQTSQSEIDAVIGPIISPSVEVYKQNVGGSESGSLASSYETSFSNTPLDPSNALIEYVGGPVVGDTRFLLVKDGAQVPAWYLFNLTLLGWDGMEDLVLSGFWPGPGAISHISLYGGGGTSVPDGGTTMALLGLGLLCIEGLRRKLGFV